MAFTLPDKGEGDNDVQSILFQEYLDVLVAGLAGIDCVLSGLVVTGGADMTPAVAKGAVLSNKVMFAVAAADVTITSADATNPRIDLIVVTSAGALAVRAGTPAAAPKPPARTANDVVIAAVYVPANDSAIATTQIIDMRITPSMPQIVYRTTTAEVTNTTASQINALNKTGSGVIIPNGLLIAGRLLRVKMGGNFLWNSGTPTTRLEIIFGGTTMYSSISGTATADADRTAWALEFIIAAQANNDQAMNGLFWSQILGAKTAPTNGLGPAWAATALGSPIGGSSAQDCDAANRTLQVMFTFNVSNSANELVVEYATVELL